VGAVGAADSAECWRAGELEFWCAGELEFPEIFRQKLPPENPVKAAKAVRINTGITGITTLNPPVLSILRILKNYHPLDPLSGNPSH
jgi:hypothetical protein